MTAERTPKPRASWTPLRDRDPSDPIRQAVELAQRGRMIVDLSAAAVASFEARCGAFHPTTQSVRAAWYEALRSWDRLHAELGGATIEAALKEPPLTVMAFGPNACELTPDRAGRWPLPDPAPPGVPVSAASLLIPIAGQTYRALRVDGAPLAPLLWRLTRLNPPLEDGPYYACRLRDGTAQCDCAEWTYQLADTSPHALCKHLAALAALGWV